MKHLALLFAFVLLMTVAVLPGSRVFAQKSQYYTVTITNLTKGQTFTPILAATHEEGVSIFELGESASVELEELAEAGDTAPLAAQLSGMSEVLDVKTADSPLPPGKSVTLILRTSNEFNYVTVASMLVPTNDGFFALDGVEGPTGNNRLSVYTSPAYDAGTEFNDELCINIPGPPTVCMGEGFNPSREGAEGFVHIHSGIQGVGDLNPAERNWQNPVARIVIGKSLNRLN